MKSVPARKEDGIIVSLIVNVYAMMTGTATIDSSDKRGSHKKTVEGSISFCVEFPWAWAAQLSELER